MIPCTDFIPAYSELFKFLENRGGREAVVGFWEHLSATFLHNLRDLVTEHGIRGCWLYWNHTLNEEAAGFTMSLDEDAGEFSIDMHACPSKLLLLECDHLKPYYDYCGHCDVLYRRVLEPLGYTCVADLSKCAEGKCSFMIRRRPDLTADS